MADGVGKTASSAQGTIIRGSEFASTMQNAQSGAPTEHIVVRGDTMFKIARQHNVQFNDLVGANPQFEHGRSVNRIYVGERIQLPHSGGTQQAQTRVHDSIPVHVEPAPKQAKAEPEAKQAPTEAAPEQPKAEPNVTQAGSEPAPKHSNAELKQMWQHAKAEGLHVSFSQYKEMQKIYEGEGEKSTKPVVAEKSAEKPTDKPVEQKTGNAGLVTQEKASDGKPDSKSAEKKGDDPVVKVSTQVGYAEGSTTSGGTTHSVGEKVTIAPNKLIVLTDDKKLSVTPSATVKATQSDSVAPDGSRTNTSGQTVEVNVRTDYKITDNTSAYGEAEGSVGFNDSGTHPLGGGPDKYSVMGGVGVKHQMKFNDEVSATVSPRLRINHSVNLTKPAGTPGRETDTLRPGVTASLDIKPEGVKGLKLTPVETTVELRHDLDTGVNKIVGQVGSSVTYSVNDSVDLQLRGAYAPGGTSLDGTGGMGVGDANKDSYFVGGQVNIKF